MIQPTSEKISCEIRRDPRWKSTVSGSEKDTKMSIKRQREPAASLQVREKRHMDDKPEYSLEFPKRDKKGKKKMKSKWE